MLCLKKLYPTIKKPMKLLLSLTLLLSFNLAFAQQSYKDLMYNMQINFYDVCRVADAHFDTIDKEKKGSGWKPYQRWVNANEYKFYYGECL